ncbi:WD repeat-containing protein 43 [Linnemannia zychae]|nr:WD repeat-containing protein 43 [Linnemannia zychae]
MVKKSAGKAAPAPATKATKPTKKAAPTASKPSKKAAKEESENESDSSAAEEDSDAEAQEDKEASSGAGRTMEEKIQDMNSKPSTSHSTGSTAQAAALSSTSSRTSTSTPTVKHTTPKAVDLQQTFLHAIHTSDTELLNACLLFTSPIAPIRETVRRIATIYVTPLLTSLLNQFQQKPNQNTHLIQWIKTILLVHSSFLMSNSEIVQRLSNFYGAVDARVPVYRKVMNLNGRLDLIKNQIEMRKLYESQENGEDEAAYVEDEEQVEEEDLDHTGGMDDDDDDDDLVGEADAFDDEENGDTDEEDLESDMSEDDDDVSDDEL